MPVRTIDLIRHGQYGEDGRLTPLGIAQIELLAARYAGEATPTELWVSPVPRAWQTGEILARVIGLKAKRVDDLAEGIPSLPDPPPPQLASFPTERVEGARTRFDKLLGRLLKVARGSDKHLVLACHGNASRYLWTRALGLDVLAWWDLQIHNGSVSRLRVYPDGRVRGVGFNDIGHLPGALQTET